VEQMDKKWQEMSVTNCTLAALRKLVVDFVKGIKEALKLFM